MPVLANAKHERFAQEIATGATATEAYVTAGYKADDGNASKLANRPELVARVQEITGAAAEKAGVTAQAVIEELAKLGFANMQDYMRIGPDGRPYMDFSALTREQAAAIQELVVETRTDFTAAPDGEVDEGLEPQGHGGALTRRQAKQQDGAPIPEILKVRFKLADKRAALVELGKYLGIFKPDRVEHTGKDGGPVQVAARVVIVPAKEPETKG